MLRMVAEINGRHLPELENRVAPDLEATCYGCHAGRTDPRPLQDILMGAYATGGIDSLTARYQGLREQYFAADAYDFRPHVLESISTSLADSGAFTDALEVAAPNSDVFPDNSEPRRNQLRIALERTYSLRGIEAALEEFAGFQAIERADVRSNSHE